MDESLVNAARTGDVKELYRLIQRNGNVLREIDEVEFADTPLHIATAEGCIDFAMEIMNLKPSFARKLNQDGLSPMHLAVMKGHPQMALRFLKIDGSLVRVKGKKGKTPLHHVCKQGNPNGLLEKFLEACPENTQDVTTKNKTALHIAVEKNNLDVVKVLVHTLSSTKYRDEVVNQKDQDGNTALHIAARNNQPQILKLLLKCKADKNETNHDGWTATEVAEQGGNGECYRTLFGWFIPGFTPCLNKVQRGIHRCERMASATIFKGMDNISSEDRNALLVILALLLTAAYQTSVSPPGGVWQNNNFFNVTVTEPFHFVGTSVMDKDDFMLFYVPTCAVFMVSLFLTLGLLKPYPNGFRIALQVLLTLLAICFLQSLTFISPALGVNTDFIVCFSFFVFLLMMVMYIPHRASNISVFILGFYLNYILGFRLSLTNTLVGDFYKMKLVIFIIEGLWLIFFIGNGLLQVAFSVIAYILPTYVIFRFSPPVVVAVIVWCSCFIKVCLLFLKCYVHGYRYS